MFITLKQKQHNSAMESGDHSKNGVSPKNQMSRVNLFKMNKVLLFGGCLSLCLLASMCTSKSELRKAAEKGDAESQYYLGMLYYIGDESEGIQEDEAQAVEWYRKAAEQGHAEAQYGLADCYYLGKGIAEDNVKAVEWYRKAAEQGHESSLLSLAHCYEFGIGVPQDDAKAVELFNQLLSVQGIHYNSVQYYLAQHYYNGTGVPQDYEQAAKLYRSSAEQGFPFAQQELANCYCKGEGVTQDNHTALYWYEKALENAGNYLSESDLKNLEDKINILKAGGFSVIKVTVD